MTAILKVLALVILAWNAFLALVALGCVLFVVALLGYVLWKGRRARKAAEARAKEGKGG